MLMPVNEENNFWRLLVIKIWHMVPEFYLLVFGQNMNFTGAIAAVVCLAE